MNINFVIFKNNNGYEFKSGNRTIKSIMVYLIPAIFFSFMIFSTYEAYTKNIKIKFFGVLSLFVLVLITSAGFVYFTNQDSKLNNENYMFFDVGTFSVIFCIFLVLFGIYVCFQSNSVATDEEVDKFVIKLAVFSILSIIFELYVMRDIRNRSTDFSFVYDMNENLIFVNKDSPISSSMEFEYKIQLDKLSLPIKCSYKNKSFIVLLNLMSSEADEVMMQMEKDSLNLNINDIQRWLLINKYNVLNSSPSVNLMNKDKIKSIMTEIRDGFGVLNDIITDANCQKIIKKNSFAPEDLKQLNNRSVFYTESYAFMSTHTNKVRKIRTVNDVKAVEKSQKELSDYLSKLPRRDDAGAAAQEDGQAKLLRRIYNEKLNTLDSMETFTEWPMDNVSSLREFMDHMIEKVDSNKFTAKDLVLFYSWIDCMLNDMSFYLSVATDKQKAELSRASVDGSLKKFCELILNICEITWIKEVNKTIEV